jgi:hypothetical protein
VSLMIGSEKNTVRLQGLPVPIDRHCFIYVSHWLGGRLGATRCGDTQPVHRGCSVRQGSSVGDI